MTEKRRDRWRAKSRACSSFILTSRGLFTKNSSWQTKTVNSEYHCDVLQSLPENVWRLHPKLWRQKNWLLHHNNATSHTSFFIGDFLPKTTRLSSSTHPNFLLPQFEIKLKAAILTHVKWSRQIRRQCWTPSQNTTSRMHLKMPEALGTVHTCRRGPLQGWQWPGADGSTPVPEIMDGASYSPNRKPKLA
jgi:hypothetical protein